MATDIGKKYKMDRERLSTKHVLSENTLKPVDLYANSSIRVACVVFASLFNSLTIPEFNNDGTIAGKRVIPIHCVAQSNLGYWLQNRIQQCKQNSPIEIGRMFPLLTYELINLQRNQAEQLNTQNYVLAGTNIDGTKVSGRQTPVPVPYIFGFNLNVFTQSMFAGLFILDQILPCFSPEVSLKIKEIPELGLKNNVRVELESITQEDNFAEVFEKNRIIHWLLFFNLYADMVPRSTSYYKDAPLITQVQVDLTNNVNEALERLHQDGRPPREMFDYDSITTTIETMEGE